MPAGPVENGDEVTVGVVCPKVNEATASGEIEMRILGAIGITQREHETFERKPRGL